MGTIMRFVFSLAIGCMSLLGVLDAAEPPPAAGRAVPVVGKIRVVPATDSLVRKAAAGDETIHRLLETALPTIGVPYRWGGTQLQKGIDCSNYIWQLYRAIGRPYDRFLSTTALSRLKRSNGLRKISFEDAVAGDLLVYGYRDEAKRWRGHVVILVDKDGSTTGHKGLVLGAHGGTVDEVQFVTFTGFDDGYFKSPKMRLCNVLRVDGSNRKQDVN